MSGNGQCRSGRPQIAVVTPFLDKRHGTERCVAEQVDRLAGEYGYEVHVYSQRVEDVRAPVIWHRVPPLPGPQLLRYLWWFLANHLWRWRDRARGLRYDLTYSPGVNCLDADIVSVHIVFAEFYRQVRGELALHRNSIRAWPRLIHRRLYYRLIILLERLVYGRQGARLLAVSNKVAGDLKRCYGWESRLSVIYHGVDPEQFDPARREVLRPVARRVVDLPDAAFTLLLIGNDWKNKGLPCLLEALGRLADPGLWLLVVGRDDPALVRDVLARDGFGGRVRFLPLRADVEFYYVAADCYVAPSLEDAFALPVLEAMACGMPVIVSSQAGASEIVTDGADALVLKDPRDAGELARLIRLVHQDPDLRARLATTAPRTARSYTWERNAAAIDTIFREVIRSKSGYMA